MKLFFPLILTTFLLAGFSSGLAQAPPPPPPPAVPDYNPKTWKEHSFAEDNVRFRFPVRPTRMEGTTGKAKHLSSTYSRETFMYFGLTVVVHPSSFDQGAENKALLDGGVGGMLDRIKHLEPKILMQADVSVDGYPGKFLKAETSNGLLLRAKFFFVESRLYIGHAIVKKGERHGFNWENDFEIPAMAFLDSLHVITIK